MATPLPFVIIWATSLSPAVAQIWGRRGAPRSIAPICRGWCSQGVAWTAVGDWEEGGGEEEAGGGGGGGDCGGVVDRFGKGCCTPTRIKWGSHVLARKLTLLGHCDSTTLMEKKGDPKCSSAEVVDESSKDEFQELLRTLEQRMNWDGQRLVKYKGFWLLQLLNHLVESPHIFHFQSQCFPIDQTPLLTSTPHMLVPFLEFNVYWEQEDPDLENIPRPRIFATHMPFQILPDSIRESDCRIIYICRNPLDQFVSHRHFLLENKIGKEADPLDVDEAFDMFCQGIHPCGPFWDHMLGYWNAHLENPGKVLFLKYEELKEDITSQVKKIAVWVSLSHRRKKNKPDRSNLRKGQVGDWTNYLTPALVERIKKLVDSKFGNSGLMFKT
ncbi:UNVERIFIED_CONTAM: Cytosolic sulfotransferase 15 [Sesamum calycinum]|uniref:Sulfotransferase n=1 Tax=Sesamum calycinum TaxID=2727403 RepID=A0AAW2QWG3_9LAMI